MIDAIVLAAVLVLMDALMWYVPVMKGPDAFFGIPVSEEFYRGDSARALLRAYRHALLAIAGFTLGLLLVSAWLDHLTLGIVLGALLVGSFGPTVPLVVCWRRLRPHGIGEPVPVAVEGVPGPPPGGKWRYVNPVAEVLLAVGVLLLVALVLWRYPLLPGRVPVHWGPTGRADGWVPKSPWPLASLVLMVAFVQVMLLALLVGMAQQKVALPAERAEEYLAVRERYLRTWVLYMHLMRLTLLVLFGGVLWASLFGVDAQAHGAVPPGMILVMVGTAVLLGSLPWLIVRTGRLRAEMREIAGPGSLDRTAPTEGWIGGMVYLNRRDPALWVEKRVGIGWTLNFAHPMAWVLMGLMLVVPIVAVVLGAR